MCLLSSSCRGSIRPSSHPDSSAVAWPGVGVACK
jgi:hypothetical protein